MMSAPHVTHWESVSPPTESLLFEIMKQQGLNPYLWSNNPHDTYFAHKHNYHKVIYVLRGSITFKLPILKHAIELRVGDRMELPAGIVHEALVGPEGVTCLEGRIE